MSTSYFEVPKNWNVIETKVTTKVDKITEALLYKYKKVFFYDTCSFRGHSNLNKKDVDYIISHIKQESGVVVITRCVLMELASQSGEINQSYIDLIYRMVDFHGVEVLVMNEEDLYTVLCECFSATKEINTYLMWAVRMLRVPTSTIETTFSEDECLKKNLKEGKGLTSKGLFSDFFRTVRNNKIQSDNLGEELLAICLHILSHIPGEGDYKYNVITEDKKARGTISNLFKKTKAQYKGSEIIIYSTPRLVQAIIGEGRISDIDCITRILGMGRERDIKIYGTLPYEFETTEHTFNSRELAKLLMVPGSIDVRF